MVRRIVSQVVLFFAVLFFTNCSSNLGSNTDKLLQSAANLVETLPDSALHITTSVMASSKSVTLQDEELLQLYEIRQKAFSKSQEMDSVLNTGIRLRVVASRLSDSLAIARSLLPVRGEIALKDQRLLEPFFLPSIHVFQSRKMDYEEGMLHNIYGGILLQKGDYNKAMDHLYKSVSLLEKVDSAKKLFSVYMSIGTVFSMNENMPQSYFYYRKALNLAIELNDSLLQSKSWLNIGTSYGDENRIDSSLAAYDSAMAHLPVKGGELTLIKIQYNRANGYEAQKKYAKAGELYQVVLDSCIQNNIVEGVAMANRGMARILSETGQVGKAIQLMESSIKELDSLEFNMEVLSHRLELIQLYKKAGDWKLALSAMEELKHISDSLRSVEKQSALEELEIAYQSDKKEQENDQLRLQVRARTTISILLLALLAGAVVLLWLRRQRNLYHEERDKSYQALMQKYRHEKSEREHARQEKVPVSFEEPVLEPELSMDELLFKRLNEYYRTERPYLNPSLKVEDVTEVLKVSQKELLQSIRVHDIRNFNAFSNKYRVAEVRRMFEDKSYSHMKLDAIGLAAGFGSKPPFYAAFEEETGMKPGYYRANLNQ